MVAECQRSKLPSEDQLQPLPHPLLHANIIANKWDMVNAERVVEELGAARSDLKAIHDRLAQLLEDVEWGDQEKSHTSAPSWMKLPK